MTFLPGAYENISNEDYHAAPGLSNSDLKLFLVSPLHYWQAKLNPLLECAACLAPRKYHPAGSCRYFQATAETTALRVGSALHVAVLEPESFRSKYAQRPNAADFPDAIDGVREIKEWLDAKCVPHKKSALKPELESVAASAGAPVLSALLRRHAGENAGKKYLDKAEWQQVRGMATAILRESSLKPYLAKGVGEVSIFANDPETGILLKCRLDWMAACRAIVDLKSFSLRDDTVDTAISKTIYNRGYHRQPWFYLNAMRLAGLENFDWVYAFCESDAPYSVRLRSMGPNGARGLNKYWESTGREIRAAIKKFAEYQREFGAEPWVYHQSVTPISDSEMARVVYAERDGD